MRYAFSGNTVSKHLSPVQYGSLPGPSFTISDVLVLQAHADKDGKHVNNDVGVRKISVIKKNVIKKISRKNIANEESVPRRLHLGKNDRRKNLRRLLRRWPANRTMRVWTRKRKHYRKS